MLEARRSGLLFVPALWLSSEGRTWVELQGRYWELVQWMPGQADYRQQPTTGRLQQAAVGLARLHQCWERVSKFAGGWLVAKRVPAVLRRLDSAREWTERLRSGWRPALGLQEQLCFGSLLERAWKVLQVHLAEVPHRLERWARAEFLLHPCLCDIHHEHLLFQNEVLSGLIDYGQVSEDHPAVDLARMLGSMVEDDRVRWEIAVEAYRATRSLTDAEVELARQLDWTGTVLAAGNWLRWLCLERRAFENRAEVARRIEGLLRRIEGWDC